LLRIGLGADKNGWSDLVTHDLLDMVRLPFGIG